MKKKKKERPSIYLEPCDRESLDKLLKEDSYFSNFSSYINYILGLYLKNRHEEKILKALKDSRGKKDNKEKHNVTIDEEIKISLMKIGNKYEEGVATIITAILKHWIAAHNELEKKGEEEAVLKELSWNDWNEENIKFFNFNQKKPQD
ncbi:MAG: hypothetical protein KF732_04360 [Flavobacteriales bacterium]|nr:hypothetical protein [Flavobacteriales bacterium]